ncbi:transglutaminase-like domain-containing protein [Microcella sp.]|uniref:transglutaminase-like domain-containing protein n=1 Tax=Microcella sp. TaxID=1913979 RepID=UPI002561EDDA|nr:transglutaminase-like domain-containing protein [Microcella sp.]MBX9471921.1 transglutaminase-like domain-containing protein [Microcella sp.]
MDRPSELPLLPPVTRVNLAREFGARTSVSSFLGTQNVAEVSSVYARPEPHETQWFGTIPFTYENPEHPVLRSLRERYDLETVAGEGSDVEKARRLRIWLKSLWQHGIPERMPEWNASLILHRASTGVDHFICIHYSVSLVQCALALGMQARMVNLHRGIADSYRIGDEAIADPPVDEHVVAEVWCEEAGTWVLMDADFDCDYEIDGRPCSAWDIHTAFATGRLDQLTVNRGPRSAAFAATGEVRTDDDFFFSTELPSYYAHVSLLMRNDFLTDPSGPVPIAHPVDEIATPILWHRGSDNALQPHLMGPVVVAQPFTNEAPVLTDGNLRTAWASDDSGRAQTASIRFPGPRAVGQIAIHWGERGDFYESSQVFRIEVESIDGGREVVLHEAAGQERPYTFVEFPGMLAIGIHIVQAAGGGSPRYPNRLWLRQLEVFGPNAAV